MITTVTREMEGGTGKENKRVAEEAEEEEEEVEKPAPKKGRVSGGAAKVRLLLSRRERGEGTSS